MFFVMSLWGNLAIVRPSLIRLDESLIKDNAPIMAGPNGVIMTVLMEMIMIIIFIVQLIIPLM